MAVMPTLGWRWLLGFLSLPLLLFVAMSYVSIKPFKVFVYFKYIVLLHVSDIFKFWQLKKKSIIVQLQYATQQKVLFLMNNLHIHFNNLWCFVSNV